MTGTHKMCVVATNAAGLSSAPSGYIEFTVSNMVAPVITYIDTYDAGHAILDHNVASNGVVAHSNVLIHGQGVGGSTIKVYDGSTLLGSFVLDTTGSCSFAVPALSNSIHDPSATQTAASGAVSPASNHFYVTIDTTTPSAPAILSVQDTLGSDTSLVLAGDTSGNPHPVVNGTGRAGGILTLYDGSVVIGSAVVASDNTWRLQPTHSLTNGAHVLSATGTSTGFMASTASEDFGFTVAAPLVGGRTRMIAPSDTPANDDPKQLAVAVDTEPAAARHTTVGEHDSFTGTAGNETIDLNPDPASYFMAGTAHIQGAAGGIDILHLLGNHQVLDLTSLTGKASAAKVSGIEVIDLGGHSNTLKLSLVDVLNLGELDLFQTDGKQQLMVNGHDGDAVDLSNTHLAGVPDGLWQQHEATQVGGLVYNVYEHSSAHAELLVQQGMQIALHN